MNPEDMEYDPDDMDDFEYILDVFTEAMYPEEEDEQWL